jgi:hypothetical protein
MSKLIKIATEFFTTFACFEYALKATGFHTAAGDASADWTKFANSIPTALSEHSDAEVNAAVAYIEGHPPRKQVMQNELLAWASAPPATNNHTDKILIYVRRVRNNFFHGAKFIGRSSERKRDEQLLQHSLTILRACLEASVKVKTAYDKSHKMQ